MVKISPFSAGVIGSVPDLAAKISHASLPQSQNKNNSSNIVTNSIKTLKNSPHQKIFLISLDMNIYIFSIALLKECRSIEILKPSESQRLKPNEKNVFIFLSNQKNFFQSAFKAFPLYQLQTTMYWIITAVKECLLSTAPQSSYLLLTLITQNMHILPT